MPKARGHKPSLLALINIKSRLCHKVSFVVSLFLLVSFCFTFVVILRQLFQYSKSRQLATIAFSDVDSDSVKVILRKNVQTQSINSSCTCNYTDDVDLRIIVIAYDRPTVLFILLQSLDNLVLDGAVAALDIWLDRDKESNAIHIKTLEVANRFSWSLGVTRIHVWPHHVGIYGQWIDTWCPADDSREMALILEEDIVISPYAWRWLRATRDAFEARNDIAGYTLQSEGVETSGEARKQLRFHAKHTAFAYQLLGTWGFAPHPRRWMEFVIWYKSIKSKSSKKIISGNNNSKAFKPYVDNLIMTSWYKKLEMDNQTDTMWSIWFVYFTNMRGLYTIYNNLQAYTSQRTIYLSVHNTAYGGMHYTVSAKKISRLSINRVKKLVYNKLLKTWKDDYVQFPADLCTFDFFGNVTDLTQNKELCTIIHSTNKPRTIYFKTVHV